ncbi:hypothetical protein VPT02_089 [Vibrio phage VPT02]|nr:hypothetical protein VPT02_089 [Vibrio phage VPT02]
MNKILLSVTAVAAMAFGSANATVSLDTDCFSIQVDDIAKTYNVAEKCTETAITDPGAGDMELVSETTLGAQEPNGFERTFKLYTSGMITASVPGMPDEPLERVSTSNFPLLDLTHTYYSPMTNAVYYISNTESYLQVANIRALKHKTTAMGENLGAVLSEDPDTPLIIIMDSMMGTVHLAGSANSPINQTDQYEPGMWRQATGLTVNAKGLVAALKGAQDAATVFGSHNFILSIDGINNVTVEDFIKTIEKY